MIKSKTLMSNSQLADYMVNDNFDTFEFHKLLGTSFKEAIEAKEPRKNFLFERMCINHIWIDNKIPPMMWDSLIGK